MKEVTLNASSEFHNLRKIHSATKPVTPPDRNELNPSELREIGALVKFRYFFISPHPKRQRMKSILQFTFQGYKWYNKVRKNVRRQQLVDVTEELVEFDFS